MISPSDDGASAGKGFMPFLKQCSTYFPSAVVFFAQRLGHFLREGMKSSPALGKCNQCMNMYAMIPPSDDGACAGKGFMPFLKQCSTYFPSAVVFFFTAVGTFFEGGHEALPCTG